MKFRHIILAAAALTCAAATVDAKNIEDYRIYINPGHGGWEGGDRHMGTVKHGPATYLDTCGFFETNTNTWKGLALLQRLAEYGFKFDPTLNPFPADFDGYTNANGIKTNADIAFRYGAARDMSQGLVMSHVKNGYSRDINEIAMEVEANNFDLFISVHSNANYEGATTNYPGLFVRGENKTESVPGSCDISRTIWPYAFANTHSQWSNYSMTNPALYYDIDFQGGDYALTDHGNGNVVKGYYAVLRHNVPGLLLEGYFHTYQPARHRAMNPDVCRIEGEAYARGIAEYLNVAQESTGDIYGIVRDLHERFKHQFYSAPSSSPDAFLPINNATVKLLKDGNVVDTYVTDDEYNGAFVFRQLEPGTYTIEVSAEGYKPTDEIYCGPFEVKAAQTLFPCVYLENEAYEPPAVVIADYIDEITTPAIGAASSYNFNAAVLDKEIAQLADKTVRRLISKGDKLYVLAHDAAKEPFIYVIDATKLEVLAEVSTEGAEGTMKRIGDIQVTTDGVLVASGEQLNFINADQVEPGEVMGECNFYKWENDDAGLPTGKPVKWFGTTATANFYRAVTGFTFGYSGSSAEGVIYLPSYSTYYERKVWLNVIDIFDGAVSGTRFVNQTRDNMNMDALGDDVTLSVSPLNSASFIVNSSKVAPMQFSGVDYTLEKTAADNFAGREGYFKFAGHSMMAVADMDADGKHAGVRLYDITDGLDKTAAVQTTNTAMEAVGNASFAAAGRTTVVRDQDGIITAGNIDLYTVRGNLISRLTTTGVEQPIVRGQYAYGLIQKVDGDVYELSFKLTGDAIASVELVATDDNKAGDRVVTVAASQAFTKGDNSVTVDTKELVGNYNWRVVVENEAVPTVGRFYDSEIVSSGVAFDLNPESDLFGNLYVAQKDVRQICGFNAALEPLAGSPYLPSMWDLSVGASPWRLAVLPTGKLLISDWSDANGGLYLFDPANPSAGRSNFFAGTIKKSSGEWIYDGKTIGGSTSGMAVVGSGDETRLISFQEDWPTDYQLNFVYYDLGTKEQIDFQPTQPDTYKEISRYLANGNVDVVAREQGMAIGQVRGSGNNTKGVPAFIITDAEGNIVFNSGNDWTDLSGSVGLIGLNSDASLFVVQDAGPTMHVCSVEWAPEFKLTELYTFDVLGGNGSDTNSYQAAFDPAGNLYVASRSSMRAFSLPRAAQQATTPAKAEYVVSGKMDGVDDIITADTDNNAPVQYYNLQGIEMPSDNLPAGVYLRRQGKTVTKVIVK